jgi:hypothetical protein
MGQAPSQTLEANTSQDFCPTAASAEIPVIWAAAWLKKVMFQSRSTVNIPSATELTTDSMEIFLGNPSRFTYSYP